MTLQQLRSISEVVACGFNVSRAASAMHTSQPAVSKTVRLLEDELGEEIFMRARARITGLTEFGVEVMALARRILQDCSNLQGLVEERYSEEHGTLRISTTHIHARYVLLDVIRTFKRRFPKVHTHLTQGTPENITSWVSSGAVHLGVSTLPERVPENVIALPAYNIERCIITPCKHPLSRNPRVTIKDVAKYPLVTYDRTYNSGAIVHTVFERHGLVPQITVQANDANVIKAYVAAGIGIAVFQKMALEPKRDKNIEVIEASHIFPPSQTYITLRRGQYLRGFAYDFIQKIAPDWTRPSVTRAVKN